MRMLSETSKSSSNKTHGSQIFFCFEISHFSRHIFIVLSPFLALPKAFKSKLAIVYARYFQSFRALNLKDRQYKKMSNRWMDRS